MNDAPTTYEPMGEFHDLFMDEPWSRLGSAVEQAFADLGPDDVVVDLGAGTGLGTMELLDRTRARVWSIEPSHTMRAVLLHRIAAAPGAAERASVVAGAVPAALDLLPDRVSGLLVTHVLGHLTAQERGALWTWVAAHLADHGRALVTWQREPDPGEDEGDEDEVVEERAIGSHTYRAVHSGTGEEFASRYEVVDGEGRVLRSVEASGTWRTVTRAMLEDEATTAGLRCQDTETAGVSLLRRT